MPSILDTFVLEVGLDPAKANFGLSKLVQGIHSGAASAVKSAAPIEQQATHIAGVFSGIRNQLGGLVASAGHGVQAFITNLSKIHPAVAGMGSQIKGIAKDYSDVLKELTEAFHNLPTVDNAQFKALGVSLLDDEGKLRAVTDIMKELNVEFAKMDPAKAAALGKAMGFSPATMALLLKAPDEYHKIFQEQEKVNKAEQEQEKHRDQAIETFNKLRDKVIGLYAAFTAGKGLKEFTEDMTRANAAFGYMAKRVGSTPGELAQFSAAVRDVGGTTEDALSTFQHFSSEFQQMLITGQAEFQPWFNALGVNIRDSSGQIKSYTQLFEELGAAFHAKFPDPAKAAEFGRSMGIPTGMMNLLLKTPEAYHQILAAHEDLRRATDADAPAAQAREKAWEQFTTTLSTLGTIVLTTVTPAIVGFLNVLTKVADWASTKPGIVIMAFAGITATVGLLKLVVGTGLFGALTKVLKLFGLIEVAGSKSFAPGILGATTFRGKLSGVALILSLLTGSSLPALSGTLLTVGAAASVWGPLVAVVNGLSRGLSGLLRILGVLSASTLPALSRALFAVGAAISATPIGWMIGMLGTLAGAIYLVYENVDRLKEAFSSFEGISRVALSFLTGIPLSQLLEKKGEKAQQAVSEAEKVFDSDVLPGKLPQAEPKPISLPVGATSTLEEAKKATVATPGVRRTSELHEVPVLSITGYLTPITSAIMGALSSIIPVANAATAKLTQHLSRTGYPATPKASALSGSDLNTLMGMGWSRNQAIGILANLQRESSGNIRATGDRGLAYGLAQWHPDRQADFAKWAGHNIRQSTREEQLAFVNYELREGSRKRAGRALMGTTDAENAAKVVSRLYEGPRHADLEAATRAQIAAAMAAMPDSAFALAGAGARLGASYDQRASTSNSYDQRHNVTSETHVGQVIVNTQATDAEGIAQGIKPALQRHAFIAAIDSGPS